MKPLFTAIAFDNNNVTKIHSDNIDHKCASNLFDVHYKNSPNGRKIFTEDVRSQISMGTKDWYSNNSMKHVADKMTKLFRVSRSSIIHINIKIGSIYCPSLAFEQEYDTYEEALAAYNHLFNNPPSEKSILSELNK